MGRLRRRATIARKGIAQILETAAEYGFQGEEWSQLARDTQGLAMALKRPEKPEVMAVGVESLGGARRWRRHPNVACPVIHHGVCKKTQKKPQMCQSFGANFGSYMASAVTIPQTDKEIS